MARRPAERGGRCGQSAGVRGGVRRPADVVRLRTGRGAGGGTVVYGHAVDPYCQDSPPFQLVDTFWSHGNGGRATAYVILQDAVTAGTPPGRPDVFPTLEIRLDDLRRHASGDAPLRLTAPTVGALCPDDADAICVPVP